MAAVAAAGGQPIGCTQTTEILSSPGVAFVAPLPEPHDLATVYTAAVNAAARDPKGAHDFVARLTGREVGGSFAPRRASRGWRSAVPRARTRPPSATWSSAFSASTRSSPIRKTRTATSSTSTRATSRAAGCSTPPSTRTARSSPAAARTWRARAAPSCARCTCGATSAARAWASDSSIAPSPIARGLGFERVELETASVLKEAMAMYEKAGFVRQPHAPHVPRCDRVYALEL